MLNDRNDMPDDHEENEYHFSDEDVSYEVETESSKPTSTSPKESVINRLTRSKRMVISLGVFVVLVFIVYKLVTPNTATVSTDISAPVTTAQSSSQAMQQQAPTQAAQPTAPVAQVQTPAMPAQPETPPAPAVEVAVTPPVGAPVAQPAPIEQGAAPSQQAVATMPPVIAVEQPQAGSPTAPAVTNQPITTVTPAVATAVAQVAAAATQGTVTIVPGMPTSPTTMPVVPAAGSMSPVDAATARLVETNERLMTQLQSDYTQKINDYATQNKVLQEQMQSLSARVSTMEAQLAQLVQALTPQTSQSSAPAPAQQGIAPGSMMQPKPMITGPETKVAYSVQAIIPGRAWLRSESGEAVTVAEGDTIKDLGRVTKIDPYDGVVEVNTGNRSVTLSYGNGNE